MRIAWVIVTALAMSGCASLDSLPQNAGEAAFDGKRGKTGWSEYQNGDVFKGYSGDEVFEAAKVGLEQTGFAVKRVDRSRGMVLGEHGITPFDWNVVAGVYLKQVGADTHVHVVAEGSKDVGIFGDTTSADWPRNILMNMREYLSAT